MLARVLTAALFLILIAVTGSRPGLAQDSNLRVYQQLAASCLQPAADTLSHVTLEAPEAKAYLASAALEAWTAGNKNVYVPDSSSGVPARATRLAFRVDEQRVMYTRKRRKRLERTVQLQLQITLLDAQNRLLHEESCARSSSDTIPVSQKEVVEQSQYPETRAAMPASGWVQRIIEPAVIIAASAIGVFLFFNLRSSSDDDV